jgi:hypothetical protein
VFNHISLGIAAYILFLVYLLIVLPGLIPLYTPGFGRPNGASPVQLKASAGAMLCNRSCYWKTIVVTALQANKLFYRDHKNYIETGRSFVEIAVTVAGCGGRPVIDNRKLVQRQTPVVHTCLR